MVLSLLAVSNLEKGQDLGTSFDRQTLVALLKSLGRDMPLRTDRQINAMTEALSSASNDSEVIRLLEQNALLSPSAVDALRIAVENNQTQDFLRAWLARPTSRVSKEAHEQTNVSKLMRFMLTSSVILIVFIFFNLFVIPEHMKMFKEFGIEPPWAMRTTYDASNLMAFWWYLFPILLLIIAIPFFRQGQFSRYWSRWSPANWMRRVLGGKTQKIQTAIWSLRHGSPQSLQSNAVSKSQTAALNSVSDPNLQSWLLENILDNGQFRKNRNTTVMATILLGAGHVIIGIVVLFCALAVFQGVLAIINGLTGMQV